MTWLLIPYMTWLSRMCGGGKPKLPLGLDQWLLAAPYLVFYINLGWWVIPCYFAAVLGLRLGHGRGFNYNLPFEPDSKPERIEALIPDSWPVKYQKMAIMLLTGLLVTLVLAILLAVHGYWIAGIILALSGAAKALAYFLPNTEWAELARGFFLGLGLSGTLHFLQ